MAEFVVSRREATAAEYAKEAAGDPGRAAGGGRTARDAAATGSLPGDTTKNRFSYRLFSFSVFFPLLYVCFCFFYTPVAEILFSQWRGGFLTQKRRP
jgi:hypothetical protein